MDIATMDKTPDRKKTRVGNPYNGILPGHPHGALRVCRCRSGYFADQWLKTRPVLLIVFFVIGVFAGFRQVFKKSAPMTSSILKQSMLYGGIPPLLFLFVSLGVWGKEAFCYRYCLGIMLCPDGRSDDTVFSSKETHRAVSSLLIGYLKEAFIRLVVLCCLLIGILLVAKADAFGRYLRHRRRSSCQQRHCVNNGI